MAGSIGPDKGDYHPALWGLLYGATPNPFAMGAVGILALLINIAVALMPYRYRTGEASTRSVLICSRNDAINNLLVIGTGVAVFWTGSGLPDLVVAFIMAMLGIGGGRQIVRHPLRALRPLPHTSVTSQEKTVEPLSWRRMLVRSMPSEHEHLVGGERLSRKFRHGAALCAHHQFGFGKAACIHAGTA